MTLDVHNDHPADTLIRVARLLHRNVDGWVAYATSPAHGHTIACLDCRLGHCCHIPVLATPLDAVRIAVQLHEALFDTLAYRQWLRDLGDAQEWTLETGSADNEKHRCPFLTSRDGGCSCFVYSVRPTYCRAYLVLDSRDACTPYCDRKDGQRPMIKCVDHSEPVAVNLQTMHNVAEQLGWPEALHVRALPTMVAVVLEASAGPDGDFLETVRTGATMDPERMLRIAKHMTAAEEVQP